MASANNTPSGTSASPYEKREGYSGYQDSQTTGVEVIVYPLPNAGVTKKTDALPVIYSGDTFDGTSDSDFVPSIISCSVTNAISSGGSFSITVKVGQYDPLVGKISDDSWVDISFTNKGKKWHVMRGMVDEIRVSQNIGGTGAYVTTFSLIGRSFQKVFENTPFYFNTNAGENLLGSVLYGLMKTLAGVAPLQLMQTFLHDIPEHFGKYYKRGNWLMPRAMANIGDFSTRLSDTPTFVDTFRLHTTDFDLYKLPRIVPSANIAMSGGGGDMWAMAQAYSDNMYTELFTEQMTFADDGTPVYDQDGTQGMDINNTSMTVVYRDKPFVTVDPILAVAPLGIEGAYFKKLPCFKMLRQTIQSSDLGVSGYERYNAFYSTSPIVQDKVGNTRFWQLPLWFPDDIAQHGLRRMDITSIYSPDMYAMTHDTTVKLNVEQYARQRRALVRDWYCIGPQLLHGTINFGIGAPHLKIGCRLKIPRFAENETSTSFYIEAVTHSWSAPAGTKTAVTVTHGFIGTDEQLVDAVTNMSANYEQGQYNSMVVTPVGDFNRTSENDNVG